MKDKAALLRTVAPIEAAEAPAKPRIGRLVHGEGGELLVAFDRWAAIPARLVARLDRRELLRPENDGREVLLVFEQGDPQRPIVVDLMEPDRPVPVEETGEPDVPTEALVDGKRVIIDAEQEIVLRCGKGYIMIRADGRVIVRGTQILSRSSGANKIKGGSVFIN